MGKALSWAPMRVFSMIGHNEQRYWLAICRQHAKRVTPDEGDLRLGLCLGAYTSHDEALQEALGHCGEKWS